MTTEHDRLIATGTLNYTQNMQFKINIYKNKICLNLFFALNTLSIEYEM